MSIKSNERPEFIDYIENIFYMYIKTKYPDQQNSELLSEIFFLIITCILYISVGSL